MCLFDFLCVRLLADYLLIRLHGLGVWEYETIFNSKYFVINRKITVLCSRNHSAVLTYIYTEVALLESEDDRHTDIHTHAWSRVHNHTGISWPASLKHFQGRFLTYTHKYIQSTGDVVDDDRHTYTHSYLRLIACTNTRTPRGAFPFHSYKSVSPYTHAALHVTCVLISPVWDESS